MDDYPINLKKLKMKLLTEFFNSFEVVLCDCDGVLFVLNEVLPGSNQAIEKIKKLGKKIRYISNNSTMDQDTFHKKMNQFGFKVGKDDFIYPTLTIINYLKKIKFNKKIYVLGTASVKTDFVNNGFRIADDGPLKVHESFTMLLKECVDDLEIGAVTVDLDVNVNFIKMMKAVTYLKRPDVLFLAGATDYRVPLTIESDLMGPGVFLSMLEDFTKRKASVFGKPSPDIIEFVRNKFKIENIDANKVLFIGDSLYQDVSYASQCGYQKLLVLSGQSQLTDAVVAEGAFLPNYFLQSISELGDLIDKYLNSSSDDKDV